MSPSRRGPRPIGLALELSRGDWAPETLLAEVQRVWTAVVGAAIAAEAKPTREHSGVLNVACSASVWAHELDLMAPSIIAALNRELRGGQVTRLRCIAVPDAHS
jgi:predicted nucleic acid-binding Zn ribbon protein